MYTSDSIQLIMLLLDDATSNIHKASSQNNIVKQDKSCITCNIDIHATRKRVQRIFGHFIK